MYLKRAAPTEVKPPTIKCTICHQEIIKLGHDCTITTCQKIMRWCSVAISNNIQWVMFALGLVIGYILSLTYIVYFN